MELSTVEHGKHVTKVILKGRLDIAGALAIDARMTELGHSKRSLIIDMSGVEFIASLGMRCLIATAKAARQNECHFVLINLGPSVAKVITMANIHDIVPSFSTEAEALAHIGE